MPSELASKIAKQCYPFQLVILKQVQRHKLLDCVRSTVAPTMYKAVSRQQSGPLAMLAAHALTCARRSAEELVLQPGLSSWLLIFVSLTGVMA